jgi:hypothetical protein
MIKSAMDPPSTLVVVMRRPNHMSVAPLLEDEVRFLE